MVKYNVAVFFLLRRSILTVFWGGRVMRKTRALAVIVCLMAVVNVASADMVRGINIDFVTIGNAGNAPDSATDNLYGAVGYDYRIGKYEVTNAQWNAFTAVAGAPIGNPSEAYNQSALYTGNQQPTNNVSWYEAAQFCNYLTSGNKSLGAYQLGTDGSITVDRIAAQTATYSNGTIYVLPTEDEWYKAAYYKPNGSGYSLYANGTNTASIAGIQSNYYDGVVGAPWNINTGTQEQNGTFDMMGNVWEWDETFVSSYRGVRGGSCFSPANFLWSSFRTGSDPYLENNDIGFRIASVPEPATILLLGLGAVMLRRKHYFFLFFGEYRIK
jgi:sulfatase modifying factor 1